jgi:putative oxidoreductase
MSGSNGSPAASLGLLVLRVASGVMLAVTHGFPKFMSYAERSQTFPDPLGVGHDRSLMLTIFAELICASLVAVGFATRIASAVLVILFGVIVFSIHGHDPFGKRELPILYGVVYLCLALVGPGSYAVDARWGPKLKFGGGK